MEIPTREQVVDRIDTFLTRSGMAPSTFGREVTGEGDLVRTIREGRMPRLDTLQRILDFIANREAELDAAAKDAA